MRWKLIPDQPTVWSSSLLSGVLYATLVLFLVISGAAAESRAADSGAGQLSAEKTATTARPPLTEEQRALLDIREEGKRKVRELVESMRGLPFGPARRALERKAIETKIAYRLQFLRAKGDFARGRGDLATAHRAEAMIDQILNPRVPSVKVTPQRPKNVTVPGGGQR
jgi:hypothetical protein